MVGLDLTVFNVQVEPLSTRIQAENSETPSQTIAPPAPSPPAVPSEIEHPEKETTGPLTELRGEETSGAEENGQEDLGTQRTASISIPPLAPARATSKRRSKRPKFKANKAKSRAK